MAYDENLILHGVADSGIHEDLANGMTNAVLLAVNATGNKCLDIRKTGVKGLIASLILTEVADSESYTDQATITIQDSDHLNRGWADIATFPVLSSHIRRVWIEATVVFVAGDIGQAIASQDGDNGVLLAYDDALETVGGQGYVYIEMAAVGSLFDDIVTNWIHAAAGQGDIVRLCQGEEPVIQMQPHVFNRRFSTNKRYIRADVQTAIADSLGICWILITNDAPVSPDPF